METQVKPSLKDTAEFYALALGFGLADCREVVRWGDRLLEQEARPPSWLIDLVLVKDDAPGDAVTALHQAPGAINGFTPTLVLLLRARTYCQMGRYSGERVGRLLVELRMLGLLPEEFLMNAYCIDDGFGLASAGVCSSEAPEAALGEFFASLSVIENLEIAEP